MTEKLASSRSKINHPLSANQNEVGSRSCNNLILRDTYTYTFSVPSSNKNYELFAYCIFVGCCSCLFLGLHWELRCRMKSVTAGNDKGQKLFQHPYDNYSFTNDSFYIPF